MRKDSCFLACPLWMRAIFPTFADYAKKHENIREKICPYPIQPCLAVRLRKPNGRTRDSIPEGRRRHHRFP